MERRIPKAGEVYRHFNGREYRVLHLAVSTETGEDAVVFETVEGEHKVYVSLLETFLSPLDQDRYPYAEQKYRFELRTEENQNTAAGGMRRGNTTALILEFLDLEENDQRAEFLQKHRSEIDSRFLTAAAESLEFTERADTIEERYAALMRFLKTKAKYESRRFR